MEPITLIAENWREPERAIQVVLDALAEANRSNVQFPDVTTHLERAAKETGAALGYLYLYRSGRKRAKKS